MTSLCAHHRDLLLHILQEMTLPPKDEHGVVAVAAAVAAAAATQRDVRGTPETQKSERGGHCCHADQSLCVLSSCVAAGCVCPCRLRSVCLCVKSCNGFYSRSVKLGCPDCCARSHAHSADVTHARCNSPPPPPLSPKPQDAESSRDPDMPTLNTPALNTQPPPLLPHSAHPDQTPTPETHAKPEHFIDLMDKFTDTLMEASEREWSARTQADDTLKACDDTHLTEIITTVLHSSSEKDYNLKELFEQHLASEKRSPQTRSQRRQEVMQAISRSHDQPATRRQSLQIKRDLARLEHGISTKRKRKPQMVTPGTLNQSPDSHTQSPDTPVSHAQSPDTPVSHAQSPDIPVSHAQSPDMPVSHAQSPDTLVSHAQSPDTSVSHTQSPDTSVSHTQSPDTLVSHTQSPDTSVSHTQSPDTSVSHAQSPDTLVSHAQSPDTSVSHAQSPDTPVLHTQSPDTPVSHAQSPDTTISHAQSPDTTISHAQSPDTTIPHAQSPDEAVSAAQSLDTPISPSRNPDTLGSHAQSPHTPISYTQSPDTTVSHTRSPDTRESCDQNPETPLSHDQSPETALSHSQSPETPLSHGHSPEKALSHGQSPETALLHGGNLSPDMSTSFSQSLDMPNKHTKNPDTAKSRAQSPDKPSSRTQSPDTTTSDTQMTDTPNLHPQRQDSPTAHNNISKTCTEKPEPCGTARSRRNIVRPQRLSSYVTEPRKMFYAACRSAKTDITPTHGTDPTEPPPSAVTEQPKTPPVSPKKVKPSRPSYAEPGLGVKTRRSEDLTRSPSPVVTDTTGADDVKYNSPIKLMLVSTVENEHGVKYTLRAARPHKDGESFDPCVEASWAQNTIVDQAKEETVATTSNEVVEEPGNTTDSQGGYENSTSDTEPTAKRRPGRPKKLKAPMEKAVKRPIGRPRKSKPETDSIPSEDNKKQKAEDVSSGEDGNKNLKITVTYGRRKARKVVCEGHKSAEQSKGNRVATQTNNADKNTRSAQALPSTSKDQFSLVMPVEDRKSLTHSIVCPKQSDGAGTRRPGRPAKVKISGISVTVTTVSPRRRKIHMERDVREPAPQRRALMTQLEPTEEQQTITEETQASVRHSARERKPSVHLLQCVAMSRSNTPTPKPRKLLPNKADEIQQEAQQDESKGAKAAQTGPNASPQDAVHFSAASVESLFDASVQWWSTSASPEKLKAEMNKRLRVMKDTWVSDPSGVTTSDEDNDSASGSSAVRMLFERDCSMNALCSWFMQTTETQSLAIVKKANNRNPCEVFQYSSTQASDRPNVCSSPQAERLRKCVKKFATVVPKSPTKLQRARGKVRGGHNGFNKQHAPNSHSDTERSQQCDAWHVYRNALDRARSRFRSRTKTTDMDSKSLIEQEKSAVQPVGASERGLLNAVQSEPRATPTQHEQITANAWSAHTLRECKVFLRKLNSANTRSLSEESNDCTVRFSISPAGGGSVQQREKGVRKSIKLEKRNNPGPSTRQQSKVKRKRRHSCTNVLPPSPKQQRRSRGVMAAKWSDFILGPAR